MLRERLLQKFIDWAVRKWISGAPDGPLGPLPSASGVRFP